MRKFLGSVVGGLALFAGIILMIGLVRLAVDFIALAWRLWGKVV